MISTSGYFPANYFPKNYFPTNYFPVYGSGFFTELIAELEKKDFGDNYWNPGQWECGMWEHDTPFQKLRKQLEANLK